MQLPRSVAFLLASLLVACAMGGAPAAQVPAARTTTAPSSPPPTATAATARPAALTPAPAARGATSWQRRAAAYLDARVQDELARPPWIHELDQHMACTSTCHTTHAFLMARPSLPGGTATLDAVRASIETRVEAVSDWSKATPWFGAPGTKLAMRSLGVEAIVDAASLAQADVARGRPLAPSTLHALDLMWSSQRADGAWNWFDFEFEPWETGDDCGVAFAASLVGELPAAERARAGAHVDGLAAYARARLSDRAKPPKLHQKAYLLWASGRWSGLLDEGTRRAIATELLQRQRPDGGWSIATWGSGKRANPNGASDGYATALAALALCDGHAGGEDAKNRESAARGVAWLRRSQREDGAWEGYSLNTDAEINRTFEADMSTAYAVLALTRCGG